MTADLDAIGKRHAKDIRGATAGPNGFADGTWGGQLLNDRDDLLTEIARLKAELAEAREALKFYASPETYTHGETIRGDIGEAEPGRWTAGKIARMALARNADGDG